MRRNRALSLLPLVGLFALPSVAQSPETPRLFNAVYLGKSHVLHAAPPRQLSLNAHVSHFLYQPGGLEIAYSGGQYADGQTTSFVKLSGVRRGETVTLLSEATNLRDALAASTLSLEDKAKAQTELARPEAQIELNEASGARLSLEGWSADGRYLLVKDQAPDIGPGTGPDGGMNPRYSCVDVGTTPAQARSIPLPALPSATSRFAGTQVYWSPDHSRIALEYFAQDDGPPASESNVGAVYDPARAAITSSFVLTSPTPSQSRAFRSLVGWLDASHLLLYGAPDKKRHYYSRDVATGQEVEVPRPAKFPDSDASKASPVSPSAAYLTLEDQPHQVVDGGKVASVDSHALWVRRTQGPKVMSAVSVGLTPGGADPMAVWSPRGDQVAYVAHGDLFVTDLIVTDASPQEMLAAGEKLPCPVERQMATNNLKQIGLAMMQYVQDYDETFPPADDVNTRIYPYLKNNDMFSVGDAKFAYHAPANRSLAAAAKPAETVLGTFDTRCAHIVLYMDGHVQDIPKPGVSQ